MIDINVTEPPFALLDDAGRERIRAGLDLAYYARDEVILEAGQAGEFVFVIHKGEVAELDMNESSTGGRIGHYTSGDLFGAISVINGQSRYRFVAEQETLCYLMPRTLFLSLCEQSEDFSDYFHQRLVSKTRLLAERRSDGGVTLAGFMLAKVHECMRPPLLVDPSISIRQAVLTLKEKGADSLLVDTPEGPGMLTKTDLLDALVMQERGGGDALEGIAGLALVSVTRDQYLFEALIEMTRHKVARVVVYHEGALEGVVELTDVLSYFSSRSYVVSLQVEQADSLAELNDASKRTPELIDALMAQGIRMRFAMGMLSALNGRIIGKAWQFSMPAPQRDRVCLVVLGSEGRGEQILKTDQDNALILPDDLEWPDLAADSRRFTEVLMDLGYPRCPGNIMVSNPQWTGTLEQWRGRIRRWVAEPDGNSLMSLAILVDVAGVAGDMALVDRLRDVLIEETRGNALLLTHLARAVLRFSTPLTLFGSLKKPAHGIDIKKGGIFPIVHGVRTMALDAGLRETSTHDRLSALARLGRLDAEVAEDLGEALSLFSELRLKAQLRCQRDDLLASDNVVVQSLNSLERDLLREALHLVKEFKGSLSHRYHLEYA
ncbi:CBS domain-containing protein [Halomonas sp. DP8Y7-1]|uniref:DUF294 nucleotidyltransferase-like domain-containing protein n=1 Tax=Halomonas sp. DP8Y7-1 TaxID=2859078 RepID=UPI001C960BC2|nr:DUF294 nucleotidyltransferase-like domain-containing protein [Halomonas sp. DP8Y7-1]MBY6028404.1 CBS domain-containing protein [Halomonas sp. DP8Y7-1]